MSSGREKLTHAAGLAAVLAFGVSVGLKPAAAPSAQNAALHAADAAFMRAAQPQSAPVVTPLSAQSPVVARPATHAAPVQAAPAQSEQLVAEASEANTSRPDGVLVPVQAAQTQYRHLEPTAPIVNVWEMGSQASSAYVAAAGDGSVHHGGTRFHDTMGQGAYNQASTMDAQLHDGR